ncbi:MAG: hypothetical protein ACREMG_01065, partial [Gemmatimonadales bacterium]
FAGMGHGGTGKGLLAMERDRHRKEMIYQVLDGTGRLIGQVMSPAAEPRFGCGAATLLLVRRQA